MWPSCCVTSQLRHTSKKDTVWFLHTQTVLQTAASVAIAATFSFLQLLACTLLDTRIPLAASCYVQGHCHGLLCDIIQRRRCSEQRASIGWWSLHGGRPACIVSPSLLDVASGAHFFLYAHQIIACSYRFFILQLHTMTVLAECHLASRSLQECTAEQECTGSVCSMSKSDW